MFEINDVVRLTKIERVSIEEIALIDDVYYIKSAYITYSCDKNILKQLTLIDTSMKCSKALRELKNNQYINKYSEIIDIVDNVNIVEEDIELSLNSIEDVSEEDIEKFKELSFEEMKEYILSKKRRLLSRHYEIASKQFDLEYDTEDKQREYFERLSLIEHSEFANIYHNCRVHHIQEDIWRRKSIEDRYDRDKIEKIVSKHDKELSVEYIKDLCIQGRITLEECKIACTMNRIIHRLASYNLMHMSFTLEEFDIILPVFDSIDRDLSHIISRIYRVDSSVIIADAEELYRLQERLIELAD